MFCKARGSSRAQKSCSRTFGTAGRSKDFNKSFTKLSGHEIVNDKIDGRIQQSYGSDFVFYILSQLSQNFFPEKN